MSLQGSLSIERMCELVRVSRASFYRSFRERCPVEEEMEVRSAIQQIAVEHRRRYGYRRICAELRRRGMQANHKRVMRIMAEDNLLAVRTRAFVVTTNSNHEFEVYLNLAGRMKLTGIDQLWVADITYIRLKREFVYLLWFLMLFRGRWWGGSWIRRWRCGCRLRRSTRLSLKGNRDQAWCTHSDRGLQYASSEYVNVLRQHHMIPGMSRPANPYDNACCESFMKTLKREEIYANQYEDRGHMRVNIEEFIERYYNRQRLHSALGFCSPEEFEQQAGSPRVVETSASATLMFFRT